MANVGSRLILGDRPTLVRPDGEPIALRPTVARLLAALVVDRGQDVPAELLIERVWRDAPPADAAASLHTTVARLRQHLPDGALLRTAGGYRLSMPDDEPAPGRPEPPPTATRSDSLEPFDPHIVRAWPLVGRAALSSDAVAAAVRGRSTVFHGDPGVGMTRLCEEVVAQLFEAGHPAAMLRCRAADTDVPLGAFAPLLVEAPPEAGLPMLVQARHSIRTRLAGGRLILGVDDLHLLDPVSAVLTSQLVTEGDAVLIATYRNRVTVAEPIAQLWHEGLSRHVHVGMLDRDATAQLAAHVTDTPRTRDDDERLWALTQGNPLFVITVLRHDSLDDAAHDTSLEELIGEQLAGLEPELRDALAVVAIAEPIGAAVLEQLAEPAALVALERRSLIMTEKSGLRLDVRMRHALYGEHVRASTSRLLSRGIRAQLADALVAHGSNRRDDALRIAMWSLDSARPLEREIGIDAARTAFHRRDLALARRIAQQLWDSHRDPDAAQIVADASFADGQGMSATDVVAFVRGALSEASGPRRARLIATAARTAAFKVGDGGLARSLLDLDTEAPHLVAARAQLLAFEGRGDEALATLREAPDLRGRDGVVAMLAESTARTQRGDAERALALIDDVLRGFDSLGDVAAMVTHQISAGRARPLLLLGRLAEAEAALRTGVEGGRNEHDVVAATMNCVALGALLPFRGRPAEGLSIAEDALATASATGHAVLRKWALLSAGFAAAHARQADAASRYLAQLDDISAPTMVDGVRPLIAGAERMLRHRDDEAREVLREGAETNRERGLIFEEACALHDLSRLDDHSQLARLEHLGNAHGGLVATFAEHASALAAADHRSERLATVADRFAAHGALALAAGAMGGGAEAAAAEGRAAVARRMVEQWRELAAACEPGVVQAPIVTPDPLTAREREVALMAADGLTSGAIADVLGVSVRTVDNHLARAFEKLMISGRQQLAERLSAH